MAGKRTKKGAFYIKEKPCIEMWLDRGELQMGKAERRNPVVSDIDIAIQRLLLGERVHVQQFGPVVSGVQRTIAMIRQRAGK